MFVFSLEGATGSWVGQRQEAGKQRRREERTKKKGSKKEKQERTTAQKVEQRPEQNGKQRWKQQKLQLNQCIVLSAWSWCSSKAWIRMLDVMSNHNSCRLCYLLAGYSMPSPQGSRSTWNECCWPSGKWKSPWHGEYAHMNPSQARLCMSFMRFCPVVAGLASPSRVPMFQLVFTIQPFSQMFSLTSRLHCKRKFVWTCKVRPQYSTLHLQIRVNSGNVCPGACFVSHWYMGILWRAVKAVKGEGRGVDLFRQGVNACKCVTCTCAWSEHLSMEVAPPAQVGPCMLSTRWRGAPLRGGVHGDLLPAYGRHNFPDKLLRSYSMLFLLTFFILLFMSFLSSTVWKFICMAYYV